MGDIMVYQSIRDLYFLGNVPMGDLGMLIQEEE